ncbi:hypothetical protein [Amycolatopsis nivea]|uniref:hypothetical protein n=1 Tax=Amycolatopsis nivea TaxID=1644109 RepID=UPI00106FD3C2|nr:hypothetical protein [Amycolatopsis nivea]
MSTLVLYTPENRLLDLSRLSERDFALISSLQYQIDRGDRVLLCQRASVEDEGAEMFVRLQHGRYAAVHFRGSACTQTHVISQESPEHQRQKDYWQRAAEDAGYRASQEMRTGAGTILDVAIDGPRRTGIEVQRSELEVRLAKSRTTKSFRAGWLPVWFLDSDRTPRWFHQVPTLGCNRLPWSSMPPRRSATALGPSRFVARACTATNFGVCPTSTKKRAKRPCGGFHPYREPWRGLTVDDVAAMLPAERIVPMRALQGDVHLVAPENLQLFQELTGLTGSYFPDNRKIRGRPDADRRFCANPVHDQPVAERICSKCSRAPAGPGGVLCLACTRFLSSRTSRDFYGSLPT